MDQDIIVRHLLERCKGFIERILPHPESHNIATASLLIFEQIREVARERLQAKVELEAQRQWSQDIPRCCPEARLQYVHTRPVEPSTLFGAVTIPVRTFPCLGCGTTLRPDDGLLGVPAEGDFTDDVRCLYSPLVAELPHRVANDLFGRLTGVPLSSRGAQGIIDSSAKDFQHWQDEHDTPEATVVAQGLEDSENSQDLRLEIAMDGVKAHIDGRWQEPKVATIQVRQLDGDGTTPALGAVLARRYTCVLGAAEDLVTSVKSIMQEAGGAGMPVAEILGDGAPWIWNVADAHFPGGRQTVDSYHLSEHLYTVANGQFPQAPDRAKAWVAQKRDALLEDRVGDVLSALKRMRSKEPAVREALARLISSVENNRTRLSYKVPWHSGLAVGSGAVEGACKHVIPARFKWAGMRWKRQGFLNVLALRVAGLNDTLQAFWAHRGLTAQATV